MLEEGRKADTILPILNFLSTTVNGDVILTVDHHEYLCTPQHMLETNISFVYDRVHKDLLLDAWSYLYGS